MNTCKDCTMFVKDEKDAAKGDCVREELDPKGGKFWSSKPVRADVDASKCPHVKPKYPGT